MGLRRQAEVPAAVIDRIRAPVSTGSTGARSRGWQILLCVYDSSSVGFGQCMSLLLLPAMKTLTMNVNAVNNMTDKKVGRVRPHARPQSEGSSCETPNKIPYVLVFN